MVAAARGGIMARRYEVRPEEGAESLYFVFARPYLCSLLGERS